jgi:hypothetical protein
MSIQLYKKIFRAVTVISYGSIDGPARHEPCKRKRIKRARFESNQRGQRTKGVSVALYSSVGTLFLDQPQISNERLGYADFDFREGRVGRVEQVVGFRRDHRAGDGENGALF